jgi:hypothetical protein
MESVALRNAYDQPPRTLTFEKRNQFSTVFPPAGMIAPVLLARSDAASA